MWAFLIEFEWKAKEKEMRDEDDSDNRMIFVWSMLEALVMVVVAIVQVRSIRSYLKQKMIIM